MSPQSRLLRRSAVAAAAVLVPVAPSAVAGAATTPSTDPASLPGSTVDAPLGRHCTTPALTPDQLRAGARSALRCHDTFAEAMGAVGVAVPADAPLAVQREAAMASGSVLALHHEHASGGGASLSVTGASCDGGGVSLSASDPWNDRISSTRHQLCTQIKHWSGAGYTGDVQLTEGGAGIVRNMNGTLNDAVTSMRYW